MKKIFILLFICISFISCGDLVYIPKETQSIPKETQSTAKEKQLTCFQALHNSNESSSCLAKTDITTICYIVSFWDPINNTPILFYDGKNINGEYVLVGVYTYVSKDSNTRTVQALMEKNNYEWWYNYDKEKLIELLSHILSYVDIK